MKYFNSFLLSFVLSLIIHSSLPAQSSQTGFEVIGRWDLSITIKDKEKENPDLFRHGLMNEDGFPGWLEIKKSGLSTLVGYYVGYE